MLAAGTAPLAKGPANQLRYEAGTETGDDCRECAAGMIRAIKTCTTHAKGQAPAANGVRFDRANRVGRAFPAIACLRSWCMPLPPLPTPYSVFGFRDQASFGGCGSGIGDSVDPRIFKRQLFIHKLTGHVTPSIPTPPPAVRTESSSTQSRTKSSVLSPWICTGARQNPATCSAIQGSRKRRFGPTLRTLGKARVGLGAASSRMFWGHS